MGNFKEDVARCEALILDVDGVMTDGGIMPLTNGDFNRTYNAKDGYAIAYSVQMGLKVCVISGGRGENLRYRLDMLGIKHIYLDCMDKIAAINDFLTKEGVDPENAMYMGDDIPDLACMRLVGIPTAPADAVMEVIEAARYVSEFAGGKGCVRDVIEQIMRAKGKWAVHTNGVTSADKVAASR
ncbi:MAG: HAD hydrolase family protein [Rikenellaceae bacterium]